MIDNNSTVSPELDNQEQTQEIPLSADQPETPKKLNFLQARRMVLIFVSFMLIIIISLAIIFKLKANGIKKNNNNNEPNIYKQTPAAEPAKDSDDTSILDLQEQSNSDELSAIEADLKNTDFSDLDKELVDIEKEISSP